MSWLDRLAKKWQQLWNDGSVCLASIPTTDRSSTIFEQQQTIDRVFGLLVTAYSQPDRHYHNLYHIHHVLTILERFGDRIQSPRAVFLAAWFHDFVYDSQAIDNELLSAKFAAELLTDIGASAELIDRVRQLILATQGHQIDPNDPDLCIFLDADLAILGADPVRYQAYARSIRREYSWVADAAYQTGRSRVLESFLQRDRLYYTELMFDELESIARDNLMKEITSLRG
jgi:predicted metal-dependent HD superfamily phosphohydrolase